jgi:DNA-binding FrmR family transcriptional regulator
MSKELLKKAADQIEALEKALAEKSEECVKLAQHIEGVKTAADKQEAEAAQAHAALAVKAKTAAAKLRAHNQLTTDERADQWAALVLSDHGQALDSLAKLADHLSDAPKIASVVPSTQKTETANDVWDSRIASWSSRTGGTR